MEQNGQAVKKRGGKRPGAGRPPGKVKRTHRTIWASEEEYRRILELLFESRSEELAESK